MRYQLKALYVAGTLATNEEKLSRILVGHTRRESDAITTFFGAPSCWGLTLPHDDRLYKSQVKDESFS